MLILLSQPLPDARYKPTSLHVTERFKTVHTMGLVKKIVFCEASLAALRIVHHLASMLPLLPLEEGLRIPSVLLPV